MKAKFYFNGCLVLGVLGGILSCGLIAIGLVVVVNRFLV